MWSNCPDEDQAIHDFQITVVSKNKQTCKLVINVSLGSDINEASLS